MFHTHRIKKGFAGEGGGRMKKRGLWRVLVLAAAAALCAVMAYISRGEERAETGRLVLWYAEADFSPAVMQALLDRCQAETGLHIEATGFADEQALGKAFENARPDLLFCNHFRAASLAERENLIRLPQTRAFPEALKTAGEEIGSSFFPIGGRLPLLLVNPSLCEARFDTLEALLCAEGMTPFLASDDWAELLFTAALSEGCWMQGDPAADAGNGTYQRLFNLLAAAAFAGRLLPAAEAAEYVRQGLVPCAVVPSTELAGLAEAGLQVALLPLPEGGEPLYPAELMGFALLKGADLHAADRFAAWLYGDARDSAAALAAGLVPVHAGAEAQNTVEESLAAFAMGGRICFLAPDTAFYANRAACEARLGTALDLLA